eukprot:jgi/Psemu1/191681/e_gw1.118.89.1
MGKSKKRNRTRALLEAAAAAAAKRKRDEEAADENPSAKPLGSHNAERREDSSGTDPPGKPSASDLEVALRTIRYLASAPDEFSHSKDYKELRTALHPLVTERLKSYDKGVDYRAKVSLHLSHQRWAPAISALEAAKDFGQVPRQGTVQRWVRDVDACETPAVKIRLLASILSFRSHDSAPHTNKHDPALALIEAQTQLKMMQQKSTDTNQDNHSSDEVQMLEGWKIPSSPPRVGKDDEDAADQSLIELPSRIVYHENALERTPPNHYDLVLHAASKPASVLPLPNPVTTPPVIKHPVPFVKDAFVLEGVLLPSECKRLVEAASLLGYRPDHPTALPQPTGIDSCEWLVDDAVHTLIYDRVRDHLPAWMGGNGRKPDDNDDSSAAAAAAQLCGINRRWRFFRYGQGCVYRPHIDGSWPAGYLSKDGTSYERDETGTTRSYLTFLIYLNEGFDGGETKFYFPAKGGTADHSSSLVARGVIPKMGSVLVFPQGNTASLLHEGSAVTKGTKYVVRTDVIYKHGS